MRIVPLIEKWSASRPVRIAGWAVVVFAIIANAAMIATQSYIFFNKDKLISNLKQRLAENLQGEISIGNIDINAWRYFPKISFSVSDLTVSDSVYHVPLIRMREVRSMVRLADAMRKRVQIHSLRFSNGGIRLFRDATGYTNRYLLSGKKEGGSGNQEIGVDEVELDDVQFISEDATKQKRFSVYFSTLHADLERRDTAYLVRLQERARVDGLGFNLPKGYFLRNKWVEARWRMRFDRPSATLSVLPEVVMIDERPYRLEGRFVFGDSTRSNFRLKGSTTGTSFQRTISLLTDRIRGKVAGLDVKGLIDVSFDISGPLAKRGDPSIYVSWKTPKSVLETPVVSFTNCRFSGSFTNQVFRSGVPSNENSLISFHDFSGDWGHIRFRGRRILVTDLKQPHLVFDMQAACSFPDLDEKFGLENLSFDEGRADLRLTYNGALTGDVSMLSRLNGSVSFEKGVIRYVPRDLVFRDCRGTILFSENNVQLRELDCTAGSTRFRLSLSAVDAVNLARKTGTAQLSCTLYSPAIDLADFSMFFARAKLKDKAARRAARDRAANGLGKAVVRFDEMLDKGSLELELKADRIKSGRFVASDLHGNILLEADHWMIRNVSLAHAGGTIELSGSVLQPDENHHTAQVNAKLTNVDISRLFYAFNDFGMETLTSHNLHGSASLNAGLSMNLDEKGQRVPGSLNGRVFFSIRNGALIDFAPIQKIKDYVLRDRDLSNIRFAELKDSLLIHNDDIEIRRLDIRSNVATLFVQGVYGFNRNTDISIQVPLRNFLSSYDSASVSPRAIRRSAPSVWLRARPDLRGNIRIGLDLAHTFRRKEKDTNRNDLNQP